MIKFSLGGQAASDRWSHRIGDQFCHANKQANRQATDGAFELQLTSSSVGAPVVELLCWSSNCRAPLLELQSSSFFVGAPIVELVCWIPQTTPTTTTTPPPQGGGPHPRGGHEPWQAPGSRVQGLRPLPLPRGGWPRPPPLGGAANPRAYIRQIVAFKRKSVTHAHGLP